MSQPTAPSFGHLAKLFEEASAHLKLLAGKHDVNQGNLLVKALKDINFRLGNIEKNVKDLQDKVDASRSEYLKDKAMSCNAPAEAQNMQTGYSAIELMAFRNLLTTKFIPDLPKTRLDIRSMNETETLEFLKCLGYDFSNWSLQRRYNTLCEAISRS